MQEVLPAMPWQVMLMPCPMACHAHGYSMCHTASAHAQVGCPMRCSFCATGKGGFARNLMPHEVLDQVMTVQEQFGKRVSNGEGH